jgi:predicted alpha/beta-hydrolase family hydrolase
MPQQEDTKIKKTDLKIEAGKHSSSAVLLMPQHAGLVTVVLAHGAGGNMHSEFMRYFHEGVVKHGYPTMKFNFPYSEARRKAPDPQQILIACFRDAIRLAPDNRLVIGGKSMGGRIASYVAEEERVAGLLFLGYPLHPPGKTDQLRDEHLYSIRKPMLFVSGTKDPFARLDLLQNVIDRIGTNADLYLIEGGGHSFEVRQKSGRDKHEIYSAVLQKIIDWLSSTQQTL